MNSIVNQVRRIFRDDGREDKDFAVQETRLRQAQKYLTEAAQGLTKAANILADLIRERA